MQSNITNFDNYFSDEADKRRVENIGNGYVAVPTWTIRRENPEYTEEEIDRAQLLSNNWYPKKAPSDIVTAFPQRCPAVWVDNFIVYFTREMKEPCVLFGKWKKNVEIYGKKRELEGLVLAGGGHYERMANKSPHTFHTAYRSCSVNFESGDIDLRSAADKELSEEVGIDKKNIKFTKELGLMDDVFSDPRCHGVRYIYLRWVEQTPKATDELKNIVAVPLSDLHYLANKKPYPVKDKEYALILNHHTLLKCIMSMDVTQNFLKKVINVYKDASCFRSNLSSSQIF
jgi:8-oxo-dGTP pyrophosphatase MutT (NUDIX family)